MTNSSDPIRPDSPHPSEEQLLAFLDSELPAPALGDIRHHLDKCTACRLEFTAMQRALYAVQEFRNAQVTAESASSSDRVRQFRARLAQHVGAMSFTPRVDPGLRQNNRPFTWHPSFLLSYRIPIVASVVAIALVVATTLSLFESTASAEVLLARSVKKETLEAQGNAPVSRSVLQVILVNTASGSASPLGNYTLLMDTGSDQAQVSVNFAGGAHGEWSAHGKDMLGKLAGQAFGSTPIFDPAFLRYIQATDFFPDASASEFRKLVAGRGTKEMHVQKNNDAYGLDYSFASDHPSGIRNAVLWVKKDSYDPFQLSIFTADAKEYRFTRKAQSREQRTPDVARILSGAQPAVAAEPAINTFSPEAAAVPLKYTKSLASSSELHAVEVLHRLGVCLGEEVYVYPMSNGTVLVQGLVDTANRRQALLSSLSQAGADVRLEIYTPAQLKNRVGLLEPPYDHTIADGLTKNGTLVLQSADLSGRQSAFHDELVSSYAASGKGEEEAEAKAAAFSNELAGLARKLLLHSWALQHLQDEFSTNRTTQFSISDLQTISALEDEHRQTIRETAAREINLLSRLAKTNPAAPEVHPKNSLESPALSTLQLAQEQERVVRGLFTVSQQPAKKKEDLARLLELLDSLEN